MLTKIEKLSKVLNEAYSEKTLESALKIFFEKNFDIEDFSIDINKKVYLESPVIEENEIKYPIFKHKRSIGYLIFKGGNNEFKKFIKYAAPFISLKVQNLILNEKMQKNVNFHETMKNIAKIIESQYELNYVIPIVGEMIDKFFTDYLLYIFLKDENLGKNVLAWPMACKDSKILEIVENFEDTVFTEDKKLLALPLKESGIIIIFFIILLS